MIVRDSTFYSLADIESSPSPHHLQVKGGLKLRAPALALVLDAVALANHVGGHVVQLGLGEDWAVCKEFYPGVRVYFVFNKGDDEMPPRLRSLYAGDRVGEIKADELATLTISLANQMVRYVREANPDKNLPEICTRL